MRPPDSTASRSAGERDLHDPLGFSRARAGRQPRAKRLAERALRLHDEVDVDRAHLEADAALLEQRQPRLREDVRLAEAPLAVRELDQEVDVRVGDHGATIDSSPNGTLTARAAPRLVWPTSTNRMETIVYQRTTPNRCPVTGDP